jgi:hypothetical protein
MITYEELKTIRFRVTNSYSLKALGSMLDYTFGNKFGMLWNSSSGLYFCDSTGRWRYILGTKTATHTDAELLEILQGKRQLHSPKEIGYIW